MDESKVKIAVVQPPEPSNWELDAYLDEGARLLKEAVVDGASIVVFPEYFGLYASSAETWRTLLEDGFAPEKRFAELAAANGVALIFPSVELADERLFNTTWFFDSHGDSVGKYRKTHLTLDEKNKLGLTPGEDLPVFELEGVPVGGMTCYDGYFPEVARVLALKGARLIFWPSLQRGSTEDSILLQARARAFDNAVFIARSTYGHATGVPWETGMVPGASCVVDREGRVIANAGRDAGYVSARIDLWNERPKPRSFGGDVALPSEIIREDRRPELYAPLAGENSK